MRELDPRVRVGAKRPLATSGRVVPIGLALLPSDTIRRPWWQNGGVMDTVWMAEGKCRELPPETFFPSDGVGVEVARRICADCSVKMECLEYAMDNHIDHGVWGGTSERERRRLARQRRHLTLHKAR